MTATPPSAQTIVVKRPRLMREVYYRWVWRLKSSPDALWAYAANTDRFNRDTHLPPITIERSRDDLPNATRRLKMHRIKLGKLKLVPIEWTESPFEWIKPTKFGVFRNYSAGPVLYMRTLTEFIPLPNGGTEVVYEVWVAPRNLLGMAAIPLQIGWWSARDFRRAFQAYDKLAQQQQPFETLLPQKNIHLPTGARRRMVTTANDLDRRGVDPSLTTLLTTLIQHDDEFTLARMRPYALADAWRVPRRAVLEMFLHATQIGMLDSRWELLCPLCRGAKATAKTLRDIPDHVHCEVCHIDYRVNFDQSMELVFAPNPSVREVIPAAYCVGGPQITPHIVMQQLIKPGESKILAAPAAVGRYRIRALELPGAARLMIDINGAPNAIFPLRPGGWTAGEAIIRPDGTLTVENINPTDQLIIVEKTAWTDQAATAADVTTLQAFRDLFGREVLRPDVQIGIGSLTIMFTDLRDSTAFYREVGDAPAFGLVMRHFDILTAVVRAAGGSIIKTNGDAVMAAFRRPVEAIRAAVAAQRQLSAEDRPLSIKIGIHTGSCIAVNLNERLDYFGTVVNIAARLESLSSGQDIVLSGGMYLDPEVLDYLKNDEPLTITPFGSTLKGFGEKQFELWRLIVAPPKPLPGG